MLTSLGDLADSRVLVVKSGDESERLTPEVDLEMDRSHWEDGSLAFGQGVDDESSSVLFDEPGFHLTVTDDVEELGRPGMGVRSVHPTGPNWKIRFTSENGRWRRPSVRLTPSGQRP